MIEVKNLHKSFGKQHVLQGVNLSAETGRITVVMGPSGEGKSVLLKHLIALIQPDSGEIFVEGEDIVGLPEKELKNVRRKFGMLFQDAALFDYMNVYDNISFPLYEHTKYSDEEIEEIVHSRLQDVGLKDIDHKLPNELSGGMRKRVGLARALVLNPKILLFDEPTTGLDPIITDQIGDLILETHARLGVTVLAISHDLAFTYRIADEIAMLYQGKIVESSSPEEFGKSPHPFVRNFLDTESGARKSK